MEPQQGADSSPLEGAAAACRRGLQPWTILNAASADSVTAGNGFGEFPETGLGAIAALFHSPALESSATPPVPEGEGGASACAEDSSVF